VGHPSEYLVRFWLAKTWSRNDGVCGLNEVNQKLARYGLPPLLERHHNNILEDFAPPPGFTPYDCAHQPSRRFLRAQRLEPLFPILSGGAMDRVFEELIPKHVPGSVPSGTEPARGAIRERLHLLLMAQTPSIPRAVIAEKLNRLFELRRPLTTKMVSGYAFYLWNTLNVRDEGEWHEILVDHHDTDRLLRAWRHEPRHALFLCGLKPRVEPDEPLQEAFRAALFDLQHLRGTAGARATADRERLARLALQLHERLHDAQGRGLMEVLERFKNHLSVEHRDPELTSVDDLQSTPDNVAQVG
jgi:hypothetical protein